MAKILLLNPNKWGRGVTAIWIASHTAVLRDRGHEVRLFDCTFFSNWSENETSYNTKNNQYEPTEYEKLIILNDNPVSTSLQIELDDFKPDVVFWSALSSHIHGEGEYAAIQFGHDLISSIKTDAIKISGGLQPTADPIKTLKRFSNLDYLISGESEFVLADFIKENSLDKNYKNIHGLIYRNKNGEVVVNSRQSLILDMDLIPHYDYSLFEDQVFLRPYNGKVVRAVDYELSRGCIYTCSYCVETVMQKYYGFEDTTKRGALVNAKNYIRHKSAERIFNEIKVLHEKYGIYLFRCQDTNFLTIDKATLLQLADLIDNYKLPIGLYIETRPEGINPNTIKLLKKLRVDGVGMGIELSAQSFREGNLNRFADQTKILTAFKLLKEAKIKRTTYNVIGFPDQDEESILETIDFNRQLKPDNITVAFYSPYLGTKQQTMAAEKAYFAEYEFNVDAQLRTMSKHKYLTKDLLEFYKQSFVNLVKDETRDLATVKSNLPHRRVDN
jgi:anaerobic magnesium-protoporphyrin IX monomethyl ester cyclase